MADGSKDDARSGVQVIARAAAVLRMLKDNPAGVSLGQIAEGVGLPRSTVQRIVGALQEERLVIVPATGGGIRLGPEVQALAAASRCDIAARCRPYLTELMQKTGETVDLSVLRGAQMVFLDQVQGTQRLRTISSVGEVFPLTTTANGRACLALLPMVEAERLARTEWAAEGVEGDWSALQRMLGIVRASGLAQDRDDHTSGISAIGFAFRDLAGDLHAISVPIPSTRYDEKRIEVEAALGALRPALLRVLDS